MRLLPIRAAIGSTARRRSCVRIPAVLRIIDSDWFAHGMTSSHLSLKHETCAELNLTRRRAEGESER